MLSLPVRLISLSTSSFRRYGHSLKRKDFQFLPEILLAKQQMTKNSALLVNIALPAAAATQ